jgi:speckle-type POZ protein
MTGTKIKNAKVSIAPPRWKTLHFNVKNFKDLPTTTDHYVLTPNFSCKGHDWRLYIYPGGEEGDYSDEGYVSIYLNHQSEGNITVNYFELMIIDKFGKKRSTFEDSNHFVGMGDGYGWSNFIKRSDILDKSKNILGSDGTLTVAVSIEEEPSDMYIPKNPLNKMIQGMFLNVETADVCFEVSGADAKEGKKEQKASALFHAHSQILQVCAPMLADLFDLDDRDGNIATASITDIKPDIFRHLLYYVYGGSVPEEDLATHAKDIIDAADKYSIVNLKLEAEAAYVKATDITMDNAMGNLLYGDAKNCALLKEAVIDYLAENSTEAVEKISFNDVPGHLMKDLLVVISRNGYKDAFDSAAADELTNLRVSALRRKLDEMGLDVDCSREAMIESIKNSAMELGDDDIDDDGNDENDDVVDDSGEENDDD